jgi:hypothetical protein
MLSLWIVYNRQALREETGVGKGSAEQMIRPTEERRSMACQKSPVLTR